MSELMEANKWSPEQITAQNFLAANRIDTDDKKWTEGDFCRDVLQIHPVTLSKWKKLPGWDEAVAEKIPQKITRWLPRVDMAQVLRAINGDTNAAKYVRSVAGKPVIEKTENKNDNTHNGEVVFTNQVPVK